MQHTIGMYVFTYIQFLTKVQHDKAVVLYRQPHRLDHTVVNLS